MNNDYWNPEQTPASRRLSEADALLKRRMPLFIICRACKKEVLNTGDGLCVGCGLTAVLRGIVGPR